MNELNGRKIAFPDAKSFHDLFDDVRPYKYPSPTLLTLRAWDGANFRVSGYLSVNDDRYRSFNVRAKPYVLEWIMDDANMLHTSRDTVHFEIVVWGGDHEGEALVILQYNQIIGSHYLAVIKADTIPKEATT